MTAAGAGSVPGARKSLGAARGRSLLSDDELWLSFFGLGGEATVAELRSYLTDGGPLRRDDVNTLVQAMNEHFLDRGLGMPLPYQEP